MANTKVTSSLIADNAIGIDQLNVSDGTNGQALVTDGAGTLSFSTIQGYTDSDVETYLDGGTSTPTFSSAVITNDLSIENGKLTINEFTSPTAFTQIRKTNTGSNLAIVSQESIYMLLDENNDQTNRAFFIEHGAGSPGTGTTVFKVEESGNVGIGNTGPTSKLHLGSNATSGNIGLGIQNNSRYYTINTDGGDLIVKDESAASKRVTVESSGSLSHWDSGQFTRRRTHFNQGLSTYTASDMTADTNQEAPWVGFNDLGIVSLRGFAPYIDIKTNYTANNLMFMFKFEGYLYNRGNSVFYGGGYTYNGGVIAKDIGATQAVLGPAYVYELYRASSDSALCIKIHANVANATYDEGKIAVSLFTFGELSTFRIASVRITDSTANYY